MSREIRQPGPDHPIRLEPGHTVSVRSGDDVIAARADAILLFEARYPAVAYIARDAVPADRLSPSDTRTWCPYKGEARYFNLITVEGETLPDAIWSYDTPAPAVSDIASRLAFYPDKVEVSPV